MSVKDGFSREQMQMICREALIEKANAVRVTYPFSDAHRSAQFEIPNHSG